MQWKHEIKRLVELLLATEDLRAVQNLTVEVQRAMYLHIEELQRRLVEAHPNASDDRSAVEIGLSKLSSNRPFPKAHEEL